MKILIKIAAAIGVVIFLALLFTFPTLWLWNWLMPKLFGLTAITMWEALGVTLLSGILFKSFASSSSK